MRRTFTVISVVGFVLALTAGPAQAATTASLQPATQTRAHNAASSWVGSWGSNAPYVINMAYGDGTGTGTFSTSSVSRNYSHIFGPCSDATYQQTQRARESGGRNVYRYTSATERGGSPC